MPDAPMLFPASTIAPLAPLVSICVPPETLLTMSPAAVSVTPPPAVIAPALKVMVPAFRVTVLPAVPGSVMPIVVPLAVMTAPMASASASR